MDFLNKSYAQLSDIFRSMTPGARITSGLLLVAIIISLVYLFQHQTGYGDIQLFGGRSFSQKELAAMEAAFSNAGLNGWTQERDRILIPRGQRNEYIAALAEDNALPEDFDTIMEELIQNDSPFETKQLREFKQSYAKQKQLASILEQITDVEEAYVRIDVNKGSGLSAKSEMTALAGVRGSDNRALPDELIETVRQTMLNGSAGLKPENLTVLDLNTGRAHSGSSWNGLPTASENPYAAHQKMFEQDLRDKIYDHLAIIPGVVVGVNVELNPEVNHRQSSMEYKQPTSIETSNFTKDETKSTPVLAGRPGAVPNAEVRPGNQPAQLTSQEASQSQLSEARDEQKNIAGHVQNVVDKAPLIPTRTKAAIAIPRSYFTSIWHAENPAGPGEPPKTPDPVQLTDIEEQTKRWVENAVVQLLPTVPGGDNPYPQVAISVFTETTPEVQAEPTTSDLALGWLAGNWQTIAMIFVGLISLIFLRGMIRSGDRLPVEAASALAAEAGGADEEDDVDEEAKEEAINSLLQRRLKTGGGSLRDELVDIVRHDPDAAANVLRSWIGDAA